MTTITEQNQKIAQFIELYQQGMAAWIAAGKILVEMIDEDCYVYTYIIDQCPMLNASVLGKLEQVGRGILHPRMLLTNRPGMTALSRLPLSIQERFLEEPVVLMVDARAGDYEPMSVYVRDMTQKQSQQVFACDRIRTPDEQLAWLAEERVRIAKNVTPKTVPFVIIGNRVQFLEGATLTASEITEILARLVR
jgi:hypothetical protein